MKKVLLSTAGLLITILSMANDKDSTIVYHLPDSVKAIQFMADINISSISAIREARTGIQTDIVKLYLEADKDEKEIVFSFPTSATVIVAGVQTDAEKGEIEWEYDWSVNETYKLLIATAGDSSGKFSLYSGYIFLPKENKWKLIGTCKVNGRWNTLQSTASFYSAGKKSKIVAAIGQAWIQRNTGSWKNLKSETQPTPVINLFGHTDSVAQRQMDTKIIMDAIAAGKTDAKDNVESVYYKLIKEGTGRQVSRTDTVTAYYRVTLFGDTATIDQAKDKPATFPLQRLIRGWQIGVPLLKEGGKIKLVIPSDLAYSVRTRSPKIPPNSILEFEIEVVSTKPAQ
jgi:FKBP-type peptidyl-prolyl cis-trans isomerase FkpA